MIVYKYIIRKHFNIFYLPLNKVFYVNFNRINERHIWIRDVINILRCFGYEGEVVIDYRNIKFDHSPRFVSVPFKKASFNWEEAKPVDGINVMMEYIKLLGKLDVEVRH